MHTIPSKLGWDSVWDLRLATCRVSGQAKLVCLETCSNTPSSLDSQYIKVLGPGRSCIDDNQATYQKREGQHTLRGTA